MRQERAGTPSICIVEAPQTLCSQPTCVPVAPNTWRMKLPPTRFKNLWRD
jgi:hypothetical protein